MDENTINHHFVCSECGMTSLRQGTCQTDGCMQQGVTLRPCNCEDNKHTEAMNRGGNSESEGQPSTTEGQMFDLDQES